MAQKVGLFVVAFSTVWGLICEYKLRCHTYLSVCPAVCYTCNHVNVAGHRDHMIDPIYHRGYWMPNLCGRIVISEDHCDRRTVAVSKHTSDVDRAWPWRPDWQSTDDGRQCHRHLSVSVLSVAPTTLCRTVADVGGGHDARPLFHQYASWLLQLRAVRHCR